MQLCVLFPTSLLPILLNDCRPVVDIILLDEVQFGVQGLSPGGGLWAKPQKLNVFSISEGDCCIKTGGGGHHQWKILGGGRPIKEGRQGQPKRGAAAPTPSLDPPLYRRHKQIFKSWCGEFFGQEIFDFHQVSTFFGHNKNLQNLKIQVGGIFRASHLRFFMVPHRPPNKNLYTRRLS